LTYSRSWGQLFICRRLAQNKNFNNNAESIGPNSGQIRESVKAFKWQSTTVRLKNVEKKSVYFAKGSLKFTRQHVMNTIWDIRGVKLKGTMPDMIRYFFILSLNRSTWMRARDKSLLLIVSSFVNCFLPSLNGGISRVAPFSARRSCMVKPRSNMPANLSF